MTRGSKAVARARSADTTTRSRSRIRRRGWVYIVANNFDRTGPAVLYRAKRESFTDRASWQGWSSVIGPGGGWNKPPTPLWPDRVGEMSVRQIDGKTVLSYFNASTGNMEVRVADDPTSLGTAPVTTVVFASEWPDPAEHLPPPEDNRLAQPYGGYISPGSTARRAARVHQSVEYPAARAGSVPRHPVRGESVPALVRRYFCGLSPQCVRSNTE